MSYPFSEFNTQRMYPNFGINSMKSPHTPNYAVVSENSVDTFESKDKVAFTGKTKRNVLLATGGALAIGSVAFLLNRRMTLEKAQKIFQKTFMNNDITLEDTSKIIAEFKEISKIDDTSDYIKALFDSARKHYGLSHLNTKLEIVDLPPNKLGAMDAGNTLHVSQNAKRKKIVEIIFHEFRHAKQNDIMASKDLERYVDAVLSRKSSVAVITSTPRFKKLVASADRTKGLKDEKAIRQMVFEHMKKELTTNGIKTFKDSGYGQGKLPKIENIDEYIEKCFDAVKNYDDSNAFAYYFNFAEKDAREAASGICAIFRNLAKL